MPALIDIRRRIRSVKNTQQITKAMKMVSAAKLRRAQDAMFAARPYARKMMDVLQGVAARSEGKGHPLLERREGDRALLVVVTADKGLCGGFNANIIRTAVKFLEERDPNAVVLDLLGRKGRDFFKRRRWKIRSEQVGVFQALRFPLAQAIAGPLTEEFTSGRVDQVYLLYNEFKSVIQQRIVVEQLLPICRLETTPEKLDGGSGVSVSSQTQQARRIHSAAPNAPLLDYLYEPAPGRIFESLLPKHVEVQVWRALLESVAAEHGARMAAMDAATRNAGEMIDRLTLYMNKVRQAAITKEIIEVVSGSAS